MCGRTWTIGSDDFVFMGLRSFLLNGAVVVGLPLVFKLGSEDCQEGKHVSEYIISAFGCHALVAVISLALAFISARGSVFETRKRTLVPPLLFANLIAMLMIAGIAIWGVLLYTRGDACADHPTDRKWILGVAIVQFSIIFLVLFNACLSYNFVHGIGDLADHDENLEAYKKVWKKRCQCLFCFINPDEDGVMQAAMVMSSIFAGLDLVTSDIEVGLVLVRAKQIADLKEAQRSAGLRTADNRMEGHPNVHLSHGARPIPEPSEELNSDIVAAHSFRRFFMAAYGWPLYIQAHPLKCCGAMCSAYCAGSPTGRKDGVHGDNCCACNTAAWFAETKLPSEDLLFVSWVSEVNSPAYYICVDHATRSVILGIRGTLSLADCLTDAQADIVPFGLDICAEGEAHKGIASAADNIKARALKQGILQKALDEHAGYGLVLLGHSLGAGAAALLAVAMHAEFPKLRCFAYSPPGGLMNLALSRATQPFVIAVGLGQDLVPRMSINTMHTLRNRMLDAMSASDRPKCTVLGCCLCASTEQQATWFKKAPHAPDSAGVRGSHPARANEESGDEATVLLTRYLSSLRAIDTRLPNHRLYPPSRYYHIMRVGRRSGRELLFPVAVDVEDFMEEGILAGVTMVADHFPHKVQDALDRVVHPKGRPDFGGWGMNPRSFRSPLRTDYLTSLPRTERARACDPDGGTAIDVDTSPGDAGHAAPEHAPLV